jgi:hypothetical protein
MISPGVNLPPPTTPELDGLRGELDTGRVTLEAELCAAGLRVVGGANASPSTLGESLTRVAAALESSASPQLGQNLAASETAFWQEGHNIKSRF